MSIVPEIVQLGSTTSPTTHIPKTSYQGSVEHFGSECTDDTGLQICNYALEVAKDLVEFLASSVFVKYVFICFELIQLACKKWLQYNNFRQKHVHSLPEN